MARIRSVHPDLCRDRTLTLVSPAAERTYVRLWCHLDDKGRALDDPLLLKADLYPLHLSIGPEEVDRDLDELATHGLVIRYAKDGIDYLSVKESSWEKYQKPRHPQPSKLPGPDDPGTTRRPVTAERRNESAEGGCVTADRVSTTGGNGTAGGEGLGVGEGEGGATGRVSSWQDLLRPDAPPSLRDELDCYMSNVVCEYPVVDVQRVITEFVDAGRRFPFPSKVRKAVEDRLGPPVERDTSPTCADCGGRFALGSGWMHLAGCSELEAKESA